MFVGLRWRQGFTFDYGSDRGKGVLFTGNNDLDTGVIHAPDKALSTAAGDQVVHLEDGVVIPPELMHRHLLGQIETGELVYLTRCLVLFKNQEASGLASVLCNGAEILAGYCNFHKSGIR